MATDGQGDARGGGVNLPALAAGATGLVTVVGGLSLTGVVGRVLRNTPNEITVALVLAVIGAALLGLAGFRGTGARTEVLFTVLGIEFTLAGVIVGVALGVRAAGAEERPALTAHMTADGRRVTGKVVASDLPSRARLVLLIAGERPAGHGSAILERTEIGPDGDGQVDHEFEARVPGGSYGAVDVAAWATLAPAANGTSRRHTTVTGRVVVLGATTDAEGAASPARAFARPGGVAQAPRMCSATVVRAEQRVAPPRPAGIGCVMLRLPAVEAAPHISATWAGTGGDLSRLKLHVRTEDARPAAQVAVVVKGRRPVPKHRRWHRRAVYRAVLVTDGDGDLDEALEVPVPTRLRRVCVGAAFREQSSASKPGDADPKGHGTTGFPSFKCHGGVAELAEARATAVQLRMPVRRATPTPTPDAT